MSSETSMSQSLPTFRIEISGESSDRAAGTQGPGADVILVDDQVDAAAGWFERHLPSHRRLSFTGTAELGAFLDGSVGAHLPPAPHRPVVALVDLSLGPGQPSGLTVIQMLRQSPITRNVLVMLCTNELTHERDLLAAFCAHAYGGGILLAHKSSEDGPVVNRIVSVQANASSLGFELELARPRQGLHLVRPVSVESKTRTGPTKRRDLGELLLGDDWKQAFWEDVRFSKDAHSAIRSAMDRRGGSARGTGREVMRSDFGELPVAFELLGGRFHDISDGVISLPNAAFHPRYQELSASRAHLLTAFAERYANLLCSSEIQAYMNKGRS
ncbi:MAG TPA: hypothetical protein DCQ04_03330 [Actinobacteria bacterium]|nr:hypothetical protein [Actinomycetota bacterium]